MKQTTIVLVCISIASSLIVAANPFSGIWCNQTAIAIYEQNGLGDQGSNLHISDPGSSCVEYKVIEESSNELGGVGRYITVQKRANNKAPHYKLHPTWNHDNNQFTSVGLFSYMKNFDGSITVQHQDLIDENRHSLAAYKNNELRVILSRSPDQYDKTKARMAFKIYHKQSDNIDQAFDQRWQNTYESAQNHLQGKIDS